MLYNIRSIQTGLNAVLIVLILLTASCRKYKDEPGPTDVRLARKYCNDPEAVNFNRDFPGTADNSVCYYPSDVFKGQYNFVDSIFDGANIRIAEVPLVLNFSATSHTRLLLSGFCGSGAGTLSLTANRQLRANLDTTIMDGQPLCRSKDTASGYISQLPSDSTKIRFYFTVVSDTGVAYHQGTAIRQ